MNNNLKRGDMILFKSFFGIKQGIINAVSDTYYLVDEYLWYGDRYITEYCKTIKKERVLEKIIIDHNHDK